MKVVARNTRARHDYEILDTVEAGIILSGQEVKSVRQGGVNMGGAYVVVGMGKPVLRHAKIQPYKFASDLTEYDPGRDRELLLHKKEIDRLQSLTQERGVTILPLEVRAGRTIKVLLGVGRGRKKQDKRQRIKERDIQKRLRKGEEI